MMSPTRHESGDSGDGSFDAASSASTTVAVNLSDVTNVALGSDAVRYEGWVSKSSRHLGAVSYTHLRAHETRSNLVCRLLLEKKK